MFLFRVEVVGVVEVDINQIDLASEQTTQKSSGQMSFSKSTTMS